MRHAHSTVASLISKLEETDTGGISFIPMSQRESVSGALFVAHAIILEVLCVQDERFKVVGLKEQLQVCFQDYLDINQNQS